MKYLTVLFDSEGALCERCRHWLVRQPAFITLRFVSLLFPEPSRYGSSECLRHPS
jgi:hypothetical protein